MNLDLENEQKQHDVIIAGCDYCIIGLNGLLDCLLIILFRRLIYNFCLIKSSIAKRGPKRVRTGDLLSCSQMFYH
jgi:hypothetical protein